MRPELTTAERRATQDDVVQVHGTSIATLKRMVIDRPSLRLVTLSRSLRQNANGVSEYALFLTSE